MAALLQFHKKCTEKTVIIFSVHSFLSAKIYRFEFLAHIIIVKLIYTFTDIYLITI